MLNVVYKLQCRLSVDKMESMFVNNGKLAPSVALCTRKQIKVYKLSLDPDTLYTH